MPIYQSAPDDDEAMQQIMEMTKQVNAVLHLQEVLRARIVRRQEAERLAALEESSATAIQAAVRGRTARGWPKRSESVASSEGDIEDEASLFVVKNLDTGEAMTHNLDTTDEATTIASLNLGTLQRGSSAWESTRLECRGLLEKLASKSTFSFRQYQLCVWQERYVFAEEDALCYQQLAVDRTPTGKVKKIPFGSIEFIGPYDETQFVLKCSRRSYTFLCPTTEARTRWIKNVSTLAGCSASTEVCRHTTRKSAKDRGSKSIVPPRAGAPAAGPASAAAGAPAAEPPASPAPSTTASAEPTTAPTTTGGDVSTPTRHTSPDGMPRWFGGSTSAPPLPDSDEESELPAPAADLLATILPAEERAEQKAQPPAVEVQ